MASMTKTLPMTMSTNMKLPLSTAHKQPQSSWEQVMGVQDMKAVALWRCCVVEMIGVALFAFSSIVICTGTKFPSSSPAIGIAFLHFIVLAVMLRAVIPPSDGHFNPSVTLTTVITGMYSPVKGLMYIIAQSLGGVLGAVCAKVLLPVNLVDGNLLAGCTYKTGASGLEAKQAFLAEFIFTFILVYVVFMVCIDPKQYESIGLERVSPFIGLVASFNIYVSATIAPGYGGAYMNPARCTGPALVHGGRELLSSIWIFWCAPALAAATVGALYRFIPPDHRSREDEQLFEKTKALRGKQSVPLAPLDEEQAAAGSMSPAAAAHAYHGVTDDQGAMESVY